MNKDSEVEDMSEAEEISEAAMETILHEARVLSHKLLDRIEEEGALSMMALIAVGMLSASIISTHQSPLSLLKLFVDSLTQNVERNIEPTINVSRTDRRSRK